MNRKLIRTTLAEVKNREPNHKPQTPAGNSPAGRSGGSGGGYSQSRGGRDGAATHGQARHSGGGQPTQASTGKRAIPTETNAEVFYYKKQMDAHTLMVIVLQDGEEIEGTIEWYDRGALKVNRRRLPNIMLLKHNIKYMYKAEDRATGGGGRNDAGDESATETASITSDDDASQSPDDQTASSGDHDAATAASSGGSKRATAKK